MPKWTDLFRRGNEYAKAKANSELDAHMDAKVQVQQVIENLQEQHGKLTEQCALVLANHKQTQMRLTRALNEQTRLTASAKTAMANGHTDTARSFARQLASVNQTVEDLKTTLAETQAAADQAKEAVTDNADALQAKVAESQHLLSEIDQARMRDQMNKTMTAVAGVASTPTPSFDQLRDKVERQYAEADSRGELLESNPDIAAMHAHHEELNDQADAILAGLSGGDQAALPQGADAVPRSGS